MKKIYLLIFCVFICTKIQAQLDIAIESFGTGFSKPVSIKNAGDNRLFIVEQSGYIQILNEDGTKNMAPFLDIDNLVVDISAGDERGLLGLAFHPNYSSNGYFYVNYINNSGNTVVSRFTVSANPDIANPSSELILLTISQPFPNHNGGDLAFGSDGYLYISSGDGGSGGDPLDNSQNLSNLLGKLLRIDVDNNSGGNNYAIPADNPFVSDGTAAHEIWAYGLRNPWKFSFDQLNGNLWIGDVGQAIIEEINMISSTNSGVNFGWRCYEGSASFDLTDCPAMNTLTFPIAEYTHNTSGNFKCSITGGYVHRGTINPELNGYYFFADYCSNEIGTINFDGGDFTINYSEQFGGNNWSSFGEDINGELYIAGLTSGDIFKIVPGNLSVNEFNESKISIYPNPSSDIVNLSFENTITPSEIAIFNIQGKLIETYNQFSNNSMQLTIKNQSKGLYLIRFTFNDGRTVYKKLVTY
ncbi:MAG: PQQ-dependent sugar dehydrogenase [Flavobacteriaceae bacterium]